jgi:hypothetical protein
MLGTSAAGTDGVTPPTGRLRCADQCQLRFAAPSIGPACLAPTPPTSIMAWASELGMQRDRIASGEQRPVAAARSVGDVVSSALGACARASAIRVELESRPSASCRVSIGSRDRRQNVASAPRMRRARAERRSLSPSARRWRGARVWSTASGPRRRRRWLGSKRAAAPRRRRPLLSAAIC